MRTTNDKKDYNLRIRLNDRMYSHLAEMSSKYSLSFSGYVRDLIEKDIKEKSKKISEKKSKNPFLS